MAYQKGDFIYCPRCGAPLGSGVRFGRPRELCLYCGYVHFADPKVAVAALVTDGERVLLVRRAAAPRAGYWALPAGYMDSDELPEEAVVREIAEETGLLIRPQSLHAIVPLGGWSDRRGILLAYNAEPAGGALEARDDVSEARWFRAEDIPWDSLAFESTARFLRDWSTARR